MAPPQTLNSIYDMFYVYILYCNDSKFYVGFTANLKTRIEQHIQGLVDSTRPRRPLELLFYEAYSNKYDALRREKYLKTTKGKQTLRTMLRETLEAKTLKQI